MNEMPTRFALPIFIVLLVLLVLAVRGVTVSTDLSFFTPDDPTAYQGFLLRQMTTSNGVVMIAVSGDDPERVQANTDAVIDRLKSMQTVSQVMSGGVTLNTDVRAFFIDHRYVLGPDLATDTFSTDKMKEKIAAGLKTLGSGIGRVYRDIFPRDPTGRALELLRPENFSHGTKGEGNTWQETPSRKLIMGILSIGSDDIPGHAAIRAAVQDSTSGQVGVEISGPGFFALNASERIRAEMHLLAALASAGIAIILFAAFRAPLILITIALPVAFGMLSGILVTAWIFGSVHGVAIAFGTVMVGVAVDYPLHLASFRRPGESGYEVARRLFPVMVLGAATTLSGFLILSQSSFPGLAQIGTLTSTAIVVAVLFSRLLLPLCLPAKAPDIRIGRAAWHFLNNRAKLRRGGRIAFLVLPAAGLLVAVLAKPVFWDDDIRNLRMPNDSQIHVDRDLRRSLGMPDASYMVLIQGDSAEDVLEKQWRVSSRLGDAVRAGDIGGYISLTDVLPPPSVQEARIATLPDIDVLRDRLARATDSLPVNVNTFEPFLDDIQKLKANGPVPFDHPALRDLALLMPVPQETARGWQNVIQLVPPIRAEKLNVEGATLINLRQTATDMVESYRIEGLELLAIGALAGFLIVVAGRRGIRPALGVIATPAVAVAATVTILVLTGTPLSFFHLLALVLVVSIGVDYELFFAGYQGDSAAGAHSFNSIMLCFVSTFLVFAVLGISDFPMLRAIGLTVALGASISFLFTILRGSREIPS